MSGLEIFLMVLSGAASVCAIIFGYKAFRRNQKQDDQGESQRLTRIESKLDYITTTVNEIKGDQRDQREEMGDFNTRLTRVEESAKTAHKRIDELIKTA